MIAGADHGRLVDRGTPTGGPRAESCGRRSSGCSSQGRWMQTRSVSSIDHSVDLNWALWLLGAEMRKIKR